MMGRLSERMAWAIEDCVNAWSEVQEEAIKKGIDRLAYYEDLEEQGRMVILPCKVGDMVWAIWVGDVYKAKCSMLTQKADSSWKVRFSVNNGWGSSLDFTPDCIGKTIFFTREEAEKALRGKE